MSFKPEISQVLLFNRALAQLPADPVQDPDEVGIEARECRRFYKPVVAELLERHHWNLATTRVTLAPVTNDLENEWPFAYAKPDQMAYPVSITSPNGYSHSGWTMQDYQYLLPNGLKLFKVARGTIYSLVEAAGLEITSFDITEADFTAKFAEAIELHLAARICHPITKNDKRAAALQSEAEFKVQRAIASDLNRNKPTYGDKPTESELARGVGFAQLGGYPLDPVAVPSYGLISSEAIQSNTGN